MKEDTLISKINDLKADFAPGSIFENCIPTADPLNVLRSVDIFQGIPPEMIVVKFLFKLLNLASRHCTKCEDDFFVEEISILLMYFVYIFQSGSHCKLAVYTISNIEIIQISEISKNFSKVAQKYPVLTLLWCYFLTLLDYSENDFWTKVISVNGDCLSINQKIISTGSIILLCDCMVSIDF